jgi:SAM-dependent methyltransferase
MPGRSDSPFGTPEMAAGYAAFRPAIHRLILEKAFKHLGWSGQARCGLDVGCGAGLSTRALLGFAHTCIGIEPAVAMLKFAMDIAPDAHFIAGHAESIPVREKSIGVITAAGSLNYVNLPRFFDEAARVLVREGVLVVYDFSPGRSFRKGKRLDEWFGDFITRYPVPESEATHLSPEILAKLDSRYVTVASDSFEIGVRLTPGFYLEYMMTETNVAAALRNGTSFVEIRAWAAQTLAEIWSNQEREVLFRGYYSCMRLT